MQTDKDLELIYEKQYLTQRLYSSRVPLSDGFMASLTKEFHQLKGEGYNVDRIIKKINFELKKLDTEPVKKTDKTELKPLSNNIKVPEKQLDTSLTPAQKEQL